MFPLEIFVKIGEYIHDPKTFHAFASCLPHAAKKLKLKKQAEFSRLNRRADIVARAEQMRRQGYNIPCYSSMKMSLEELEQLHTRRSEMLAERNRHESQQQSLQLFATLGFSTLRQLLEENRK